LVSQLREDLLLFSSYLSLRVPNGLYLHAINGAHPSKVEGDFAHPCGTSASEEAV
jgi:hypothetical protein